VSIWKCIEIHAAGAAVERNISSAERIEKSSCVAVNHAGGFLQNN